MATLLFTAIGTAVGGPLGGAIGTLIGSQVDRAIIGSPHREGPRLKELAVTTSTYGAAIPRQFGRMRAPGTIIWATDLAESSERQGGGKGGPSVTTYSYAVSFAVALSSRPIIDVGRIWADGNLLRGAAGDLKVGGALRIYRGYGDQAPDPLMASALGSSCPAFRGTAYCVFEELQLADFGNRIPALTFEVIADEGTVSLAEMAARAEVPVTAERALPGLAGFADEGGALADMLGAIDAAFPLTCTLAEGSIAIGAGDALPEAAPLLPEAVADPDGESFGGAGGTLRRRRPDARAVPDALRYYDPSRDFQASLQRADGRARKGRGRVIDFPGALVAGDARDLANAAAERAGWGSDRLAWRMAEIDPAVMPGQVVCVPAMHGYWRVESWEWREGFVELELVRLPGGPTRQSAADAGQALPAQDLPLTPTVLAAFELPWDGQGTGTVRQVFAAASSASTGWPGAALYEQRGAELHPLGITGRRRCVMGTLATALPPAAAMLIDRQAACEVQLASADFMLSGATPEQIANGANRALAGSELLQFGEAEALGGGLWRLRGLLRGRGGSEAEAGLGVEAGATFVLLDGTPMAIDAAELSGSTVPTLAALSLADSEPVLAVTLAAGRTLRPLCPVHPRARELPDGGLALSWIRRARGAWGWPDGIETPLNEETERYLVGVGDIASPAMGWESAVPTLTLDAAEWSAVRSGHAGAALWVRQLGRFAASDPLHLLTIA